MAGNEVTGLVFLVCRCNMLALLCRVGASGMESAALGRICRRRNIAVQNDTVHLYVGIGIGNCREERLGVGVQGVGEDLDRKSVV